jgi:hypothetical protein
VSWDEAPLIHDGLHQAGAQGEVGIQPVTHVQGFHVVEQGRQAGQIVARRGACRQGPPTTTVSVPLPPSPLWAGWPPRWKR